MIVWCVLCAKEQIRTEALPGNRLCDAHITSELLRVFYEHRNVVPQITPVLFADRKARRVRSKARAV